VLLSGELLKLGPSQLTVPVPRRARVRTSRTPAAWLRALHLAQAWLLLEAGGFSSVTQVAEAVGFASSRYVATLDAGAVRSTHQCIFDAAFSATSASPYP
jgi:AraC-like DNA-binding protein